MSVKGRPRRRASGGKVIYVAFGQAERGRKLSEPEAQTTLEGLATLFTAADAARLSGVTPSRLRSLARGGIAPPTGRRRAQRAYTFGDLIVLRTIAGLLARKVRLREIAAAVGALRIALPKTTRPLSELRIVSDGRTIIVRARDGAFEPLTGQMLLDFEVKSLRDDVVRAMRASARERATQQAYELYVRASSLDEDPETIDDAERLYRNAVALDPWLAIAYTNLGNVRFRRGHTDEALGLYEKALALDPNQPEAHYNLGYVLLERSDANAAIPYLEAAVRGDGSFADAYFYLAMAYESIGLHERAEPSWRQYLELEPAGTWAEIARQHLCG